MEWARFGRVGVFEVGVSDHTLARACSVDIRCPLISSPALFGGVSGGKTKGGMGGFCWVSAANGLLDNASVNLLIEYHHTSTLGQSCFRSNHT